MCAGAFSNLMAADPTALLAANCCLSSYTNKQLMVMAVQLLATIADMALDPPALLELNCCLTSYTERQLQAMTVQLLQGVVDGGGGGGGSSTTTIGAGPPAPASGAVGDFYWDSTNKNLYIKDADGWNIH